VAASCAAVGGGLLVSEGIYDDSVGLVIGDGSAGGIIVTGMVFVAVVIVVAACGDPASDKAMSLLSRCLWGCFGLPCRFRRAACFDLEGDVLLSVNAFGKTLVLDDFL
jgi:hypothetical protein